MPSAALDLDLVTADELAAYHRDGFLIKKSLFSREEVDHMIQYFMDMHARKAIPGYTFLTEEEAKGDPLKLYPRIMHPHRWDKPSLEWLVDARAASVLRALLGEEPVATQSMMYFKPPGAKGQAFHQDNFYLRVRPKSCIAFWLALDRTDPDNGGLQVCPGTHTMDVACPERANLDVSFSTELVAPPTGHDPVPAILEPGDALFFNGSVVHGSTPNSSQNRWRRSWICHYAPESMREIAKWYFPILDMQGNEVKYGEAEGGGPCGTEAKGAH
ncbi:MAG: phytanoyl-CoA dioxygenase family protein [Planctomycetota bacterium]|nr:phytanoyl-CoA dioxygenase family protein [Planctomycetota bacterium]